MRKEVTLKIGLTSEKVTLVISVDIKNVFSVVIVNDENPQLGVMLILHITPAIFALLIPTLLVDVRLFAVVIRGELTMLVTMLVTGNQVRLPVVPGSVVTM